MTKLIVGFGEALVDVLPSGEVVGGAPLNFSLRAAGLCRPLGWSAALVTRIGSDARGEQILQELARSQLDTSAVQVDLARPTGYVDVTLQAGQPSYVIGQNVAWDHIAFQPPVPSMAQRAAAVCFGTLAQRCPQTTATLDHFLNTAEQAVKIVDINLRQPYPDAEVIRHSLTLANVLKCNEEELRLLAKWLDLTQREQPQRIASELQETFQLDSVFWTRGASGCVLQRGAEQVDGAVPQLPRAENADSVGAGDAASAALAVGLVAQWPAERIVRTANYCGAFAASCRGATAPFPQDFLQQLL
ncbi:MAG: hypothetical protein KDA45_03505 [Planctomycetales bacterium]|nr:hypothetical protein [Planctomycetales bacterium]